MQDLLVIKQAVPELGNFRNDLQFFSVLMEHIGNSHRFTADQLNTLVTGWDGQGGKAKEVLVS